MINKEKEKKREKVEEAVEQARQEEMERERVKWQNCRAVTFDYSGKAVRLNQERMPNVKCMRLRSNTKALGKSMQLEQSRGRSRSKTEGAVAENVSKIRKVGEVEEEGLFVTQRKELTLNSAATHIDSKIGENLSMGVSITDLNTHVRHNGASR